MKFKFKVVSAAVICALGVAHQAQALTIVGNSPTTLATEQLPSVTNVTLNNVGFNSTSQGVVAGNSYSISIKLSGGAWNTAGTLTQIDQTTNLPYITETFTPEISTSVGGNTNDTLKFTINGVAAVNTSSANTFFRLSGATVSGVAAALVSTGVNDNGCGFTTGQITITGKYFNSIGSEVDLPVGTGNTGVVVVADQGVIGTIAPTANPILDVLTTVRPGAAPAASKFLKTLSNGTQANVTSAPIGTFQFANKQGTQGTALNSTIDYTLAVANDGGAAVSVTASQGWGTGSSIYLIDDTANTACAADTTALIPVTAGVPIAGAVTSGAGNTKTLTFPAGSAINDNAANRTKQYTVCYSLPGNSGNVPTSQFTGYASLLRTSASADVADFSTTPPAGATCLAPLARATINGGIIYVRNYSPAAANAFGWNQLLRIINAGSVATPISAYFLYADGTASVTRTIVPNIAIGGSVTITNTDIETAMGVSPMLSSSNPRLVITGSTERLRVQNYIVQPGGNWVEASGGQDDGDGPAGTNN